jgi:hypothetical protein
MRGASGLVVLGRSCKYQDFLKQMGGHLLINRDGNLTFGSSQNQPNGFWRWLVEVDPRSTTLGGGECRIHVTSHAMLTPAMGLIANFVYLRAAVAKTANASTDLRLGP